MIPNTEQDSKSSRPYLLLLLLTIGLYALNFHINDIWTENESFYADAVREMFESGNFLDIRYNYEDRFQKPPMTYWMIAASVALLGNSEFAIRLPILLAAIATAMLTYETARLLHGKKVALLAFALQALSIQFIAGKQYASPEIPLAFFFSLTLYLFIRGRTSGKPLWTILAAFALGLTMLTKGYPYLIVIGGIIGLYLVLESGFRTKQLLEELKKLHLPVTLPLILVTGVAWTVIMYLLHGDEFAQVLQKETINRALTRKSSLDVLENLLFYPEVILWSFFPYSLLFYTALVQVFRKKGMAKTLTFSLSWFAVMLVIFTIAKGKIPTYFIQAHPAMAIITAVYLSSLRGSAGKGEQLFVLVLLVLSSVIALIIGTLMIPVFDLHPLYYIAPGGAGAFMLYALFRKHDDPSASLLRQLQPFATTWAALFILAAGVMPQLEESRPYDQIRSAIRAEESIAATLPIYLQGSTLHNLPYYAERRVEKHVDPAAVQHMPGPVLALLETDAIAPDFKGKILWKGMIYRKRSSESRLLIFIRSHLDAKKGDTSGFRSFSLIYKPEQLQDVQ